MIWILFFTLNSGFDYGGAYSSEAACQKAAVRVLVQSGKPTNPYFGVENRFMCVEVSK